MSYSSMLAHRCTVLRLEESDLDGMPVHSWTAVATGVRCFLDLSFARQGKDPRWSQEAGRPADRTGTLFVGRGADVRSGDRVSVVVGPAGVFQVEGAVDQAWRPTRYHHQELGVVEVANQLGGA